MCKYAKGCCCGCCSLNCSLILIILIDITMGIISAGLVYMIIVIDQPKSGIISIVVINLIALILAIACLSQLLKQTRPKNIPRKIYYYYGWKVTEFFIIPLRDIFTIAQLLAYYDDEQILFEQGILEYEKDAQYYDGAQEERTPEFSLRWEYVAIGWTIWALQILIRLFFVYQVKSYITRL